MTHLYDGARRGNIAVHHRGVCGSESDPADTACYEVKNCSTGEYNYFYDFCIARNGDVYTSFATACESVPFYRNSTGGATCGANCNSASVTAVMMQRCYGGSGCSCPQSGFTDAQLCGLAYVSLHLGVPASLANHKPHRKWGALAPCGGGCATECCGTNLADDSLYGWTSAGQSQMNRMLWMRGNLANGCSCTGIC